MTQTEDRLRSGLRAEAEALTRAAGPAQSTTLHRRRPSLSGAGTAVFVAALVLVVFGGVSLLPGGGEEAVNQPAPTPTNAGGPFQAVPFSGDTWQFEVTEETKTPAGAYEVCFALVPTGAASGESWVSSPWCDDWPKSDPRLAPYLLGVHTGLATATTYVMVVELNDQPVNRVTVAGAGVDATVTPFALPGSGKQFAVVEVPQTNGTITVSAVAETGAVLDEQEGAGRIDPLVIDGTPIDDTTMSRVAAIMGGEPISAEELERFTGGSAHSGYLIESTTTADGAFELGLIVYREEPLAPLLEPPMVCFSEYAMTQGVNVAGGATCAYSQEMAEEIAQFHLSASGACGLHPQEEPVVDGNWLTLAVWGLPETAGTVTVSQGDDTTVEIEARNGVALHIWEGQVDITSITFDSITPIQQDFISKFLPIEGIGDDCNQSNGSG